MAIVSTNSFDVERVRAETAGSRHHAHLNNAGASLMPAPVLRAVRDHLALEELLGGYEAAADRAGPITGAYDSVAALIGASRRNVAFTQSATVAFLQALSAIPFRGGDTILTTRNDYVSNQMQFLALERRFGVRVMRAPDAEEGGLDLNEMARLIDRHRPALVCVTHVPTNSGLVQDVQAVGAMCRAADVLYIVDACQSAGQMPLDVGRIQCDFLSVTCRKWLRGPRGTGFLFVADRVLDRGLEPLFIDYRGAEWQAENRYRPVDAATRFETWESAPALILGAGEAARYAGQLGLDTIAARVSALAARVRNAVGAMKGVRVLDRGTRLCGIVSIDVGKHDPRELVRQLQRAGVSVGAQSRAVAVLDFDAKGVAATLRISPHYFNTEDEVDRALEILERLTL
jgi:selenocysteine lyase/cysteine desulfurase